MNDDKRREYAYHLTNAFSTGVDAGIAIADATSESSMSLDEANAAASKAREQGWREALDTTQNYLVGRGRGDLWAEGLRDIEPPWYRRGA